ncbi:hypothetical protein DYB32_006025 [Aphanomyces invadans]|uniref:B30.2/SPRY domain-containing protein n=1 Tax=Aphanomyces invadans TaxID=157072 RepID=A0A418ASN8_9STRA|nr:hypothetical protein DYB32_006025 [Aphanomyces invadans]
MDATGAVEQDRRGQANVHYEILQQENASSNSRSQRILGELAVLCSDRDTVLSTDSLQYLSTAGRAEGVKLSAEKVLVATSGKKDDYSCSNSSRMSSEASRRQRVEELTRFFMEAKSDIEFALSGGGRRNESMRATSAVAAAAAELDLNDDDRDMIDSSDSTSSSLVIPPLPSSMTDQMSGDADTSSSSTPLLPPPPPSETDIHVPSPAVPLHIQLLEDAVDPRVFHPLLLAIRETDPLLYGTIVCHPLVTGHDAMPKKFESGSKRASKKKKQRGTAASAASSSKSKKPPEMYHPDFTLPPLTPDETALNLARFVARAIGDRSVQALLLVVKVMASYPLHEVEIPVGSHLQILSGQAPPPSPSPPASVEKDKERASPNAESAASLDFISSVMELEGQLDPLAALRSRLEALMARAIALSLSPEVGLKDEKTDVPPPPLPLTPTIIEQPTPVPFSPDELWRLYDPLPDVVDGATVIMYCLGALLEDCQSYVASVKRSILPAASPVLHLFHVDVVGTAPASVGLGQSVANPNPVPTALKVIVERYTAQTKDMTTTGELRHPVAVQYHDRVLEQALVTWVHGLAYFYPDHSSRHRLLVAELYQQLFDKVQAEIHTIWNELPLLADLLLRHVHIYPTAQSPPPSAFPHAPLVANVTASSSPVLLLLRALQDGMLQCIHGIATGSNGLPSPAALEFDPSRCAETLTLVDNNTSAKQHTAKQWGMVLSTYACAPNTGLHEWAVRLDRCEKGHVFLGVCTRDAAVSTYVGGDRQGWGLIGTRALWHNRSKVRGDYGDGFSTGSTVRVRLNTDTGALSFGLLDDDSDWGTAFDGLTQYGALYPAIGLYQRDDQVTLVHTHNFSGSMPIPKALSPTHLSPRRAVHGSESPFPTQSFAMDTDVVFQTLVSYTLKVLDVEQLSVPLLSALALMKASWRVQFAWHLLPAMVELVKRLDSEQHPWQLEIGGTWELKSSAAGNIPAQQYVVELTQDSRGGDLTGHSVSTNAVSLKGTLRGTKVNFLETWIQGSTCLVAGRVRVDGKTFAGTYEDTKSHTSGRIMGECKASASTAPSLATSAARPVLHLVASTLVGAYISSFLTHDAPVIEKSMIGLDESEIAPSVADAPFEEYDEWINCSLLSGGLPLADISRHLQALVQTSHHPLLPWFQPILPPPLPATSNEGFSSFLQDLLSGRESGVDSYVTKHAGESAFVRLGGEAMKTAKRTVLAAMLWHAQVASIDASQEDIRPSENILHIWRSAHRVIEWGIRTKNANAMTYASVATLITRRARFLLRLQPIRGHHVLQERAFSEIVMNVSRFIEAGVQLKRLESMMLQNCSRAYFRMLGLNAMRAVVELGLQQSAGLCGVLQWLSNVDSLDQSVSIHGGSHYLDALGGAGTALHRQVRESWEQLYGNLAALLSRATWAKDHDVQLVVLQAWGVIITPDDHAFISRVGIFRTLQTVLDEARSSAASSSDNHSPTKPIVQAALKLLPRSTNAPTHEIMFRGAKGVLVGLDVEKGAAEVLLHKNGASVPLEDISALPDVECKSSDISQPILAQLVQNNLPYFLTSVLNSNDDPSDHDADDAGDTNESQDANDQLVALIISLMGFRALGSLVQQGDVLVWLRASIPALFQVATIHTQNTSDIGLLEEHWIQMYKKWCDTQCPPSVDASDGDAAHDTSAAFAPPSALCQQMMEMGFPREWCIHHTRHNGDLNIQRRCEVALQKCSYQVEAAINFCFEHSSDMDRLVKQPNKWIIWCVMLKDVEIAFSGASERGDGVGDGPHSWAYDGWRQMKWHGNSCPYGLKWKPGDVIGCGIDCDAGMMFFTLNGKNMDAAFRGVEFAGGTKYVGEEYFDCRYFAKDIKASGGARIKSTVDPTMDFRALTRALAILHCRKMLVYILAASPTSLLDDVPTELVTTFLKLVATYTSPASTVSEIFKPAVVTALSPHLEDAILRCIDDQIRLASGRKYAKIHWDSAVESIVTNQLSMLNVDDPPVLWHDSHVLAHPNVGLAEFVTTLMASKHPVALIQAWSRAFRSPSMNLKEKAFRILSGLVPQVPISQLEAIPVARLHALTCARLAKEYVNYPVVSKYLESLMELTATLFVVSPSEAKPSLEPRITKAIQLLQMLDQLPVVQTPSLAPPDTESPPSETRLLSNAPDDDDMSSEDQNASLLTPTTPPSPSAAPSFQTSPTVGPPVTVAYLTPAQKSILLAAQYGFKVGDTEWHHGFEMGVLSDEASQFWSGQLNQPVRWPNDALYTYRWGADGQYDLTHVEVDSENQVITTYPTPEIAPPSKQQVQLGVIFRLHRTDLPSGIAGVVEYPDMNAVIAVVGQYAEHSMELVELGMVQGDVDMGWQVKFGCDRWVPGTQYHLTEDGTNLTGEYTHSLWQPETKTWVPVQSTLEAQSKHLFVLDKQATFSTMNLSDDRMSVQCTSGEARNLSLGTVGFSSGIHYWEVRVDHGEFGSVFLGVCEKHVKGQPSLNLGRWQGWGFVNFRATYHNSTERIYGDHFNTGDTIGVCLNMESGKLSFFMDGIKYGEHIVTDLGVAFDGLKSDRHIKTLYPCIGLRKAGDKVTLNGKWVSQPGLSPTLLCQDNVELQSVLHAWSHDRPLPLAFMQSSYAFYTRWRTNRYRRVAIRSKGMQIDVDTSVERCIQVCGSSPTVLVAGDRVRIISKGGRALDAPEEAIVLGMLTQGNEGGEEGRGYAWYWDNEELPELVLIKRNGIEIQATTTIPPPDTVASATNQAPLVGFDAFCTLAQGTFAKDQSIVDQINSLCATVGVDVINLPCQAVDIAVQPRVALLMVLNQKVLRSLPLVRFDDRSVRALRRLTFTSTKLSFWDATLKATATPTPLPSDEYEDPREIRIIRINRIQAQASKLALCPSPSDRLRKSVFGQLYREMRTWSDSGMNQDKFVLNPSCGTISVAVGPIALELHRFLGKLIGTAVRHGLQMGLDLPSVVWRPLVGLPLNRHHLEDIDVVAFNTLTTLETLPPSKDADEYCKQFTFTTHLSDGTEVALRPDGETQHVDYASRDAFVDLTFKKRLVESGPQLAALREGLSAVIPMEIAGLFTAKELETLVCGRREVDVSLLKQCTEYEDVDPNSDLIVAFWQVLEEFSPDERTLFLLFVWARSRMPNSAKDFPMNFKIQAPHDQGARSHPDQYLPHAQTCFFSLSLPAYSTKEILKAKLLYAIQNSPNMDADVRLHNAEGWADA